jgi:hypothetical protein
MKQDKTREQTQGLKQPVAARAILRGNETDHN